MILRAAIERLVEPVCALCGLRGRHTHRPHIKEAQREQDGVRATLTLANCLTCGQSVEELASDQCPAILDLIS